MSQHIAIKCTYNNADEGLLVGFNGTCSEEIIKLNIENGRIWCSQNDCKCKKYYNNGFKGDRPKDPCYESRLFKDWKYGAGWYHTGKRKGTPIHFLNVEKGKIALLTTRFPNDNEIDRKIIGFFKIDEITNNSGEETILIGDKRLSVRLSLEEAKELYFWDYYSTSGGARWGHGLNRYLNDNLIVRILVDLQQTLRDENVKSIVNEIISNNFSTVPVLPALGPRNERSGNRRERIAKIRKYGSGGEGENHKNLKEWIAQNPNEIGLTNVKKVDIEYSFLSGDRADIVFKLSGNKYVVVEIETIDPLPGCYQALKYRTLKCAELGLDINSLNVEGFVVAWLIPEDVRNFCNKYGIRFIEKKI